MASDKDPQVKLELNLNKKDADRVIGQIEKLVKEVVAALDKASTGTEALASAIASVKESSQAIKAAFDAVLKTSSSALTASARAASALNKALEKTIGLQERARANLVAPTPAAPQPSPANTPISSNMPGVTPIIASLVRTEVVAEQTARTISTKISDALKKVTQEAQALQQKLEAGEEVSREQANLLKQQSTYYQSLADIENSRLKRQVEKLSLQRQEDQIISNILRATDALRLSQGQLTSQQQAVLAAVEKTEELDKQRIETLKTGAELVARDLQAAKEKSAITAKELAAKKKIEDQERATYAIETQNLALKRSIANLIAGVPKNLLDAVEIQKIQTSLQLAENQAFQNKTIALKRTLEMAKEMVDLKKREQATASSAKEETQKQRILETEKQILEIAKRINKEADIGKKLGELKLANSDNDKKQLQEQLKLLALLKTEAAGTFKGLNIGQFLSTDVRRGLLDIRDLGQSLKDVGRQGNQLMKPAIDSFVELDRVSQVTKSLIGDTTVFDNIREKIRTLPPEMGKFEDIMRAVQKTINQGFGPAEAFDIASSAIKTAIANGVNFEQVLNGSQRIFSQYKEALQDINGTFSLMQQAADAGASDLEDFSSGLPSFIGQAKAAGLTLEETLATYAKLSTALGASKAAFSFGRLLQDLTGKSEAARAAAEELGIELGQDVISKKGGIAAFFRYLNEKGIKDLGKVSEIFRETRGERGFLALGSEEAIQGIEQLTGALTGGTANLERFQTVVSGTFGDSARLAGGLDRLKNTVGEMAAPILGVASAAVGLANSFADTFPTLSKTATFALAAGANIAFAAGTVATLTGAYFRLSKWKDIIANGLLKQAAYTANVTALTAAETKAVVTLTAAEIAAEAEQRKLNIASAQRTLWLAKMKHETNEATIATARLTLAQEADRLATQKRLSTLSGIGKVGAFAAKNFIPITVGLIGIDIALAAWDAAFGKIKSDSEDPIEIKVQEPVVAGQDEAGRKNLVGEEASKLKVIAQEEFNAVASEYNVILKDTADANREAAKQEADHNRRLILNTAAYRQEEQAIRDVSAKLETRNEITQATEATSSLQIKNSRQLTQTALEHIAAVQKLNSDEAVRQAQLDDLIKKQEEFNRVTKDGIRTLKQAQELEKIKGNDESFASQLAAGIIVRGGIFQAQEDARKAIEREASLSGGDSKAKILELTQLLNSELDKSARDFEAFTRSLRGSSAVVASEMDSVAQAVNKAMEESSSDFVAGRDSMALVADFAIRKYGGDFKAAMKDVSKAILDTRAAWKEFKKESVQDSGGIKEKIGSLFEGLDVLGENPIDIESMRTGIASIAREYGLTIAEVTRMSTEELKKLRESAKSDAKAIEKAWGKFFEETSTGANDFQKAMEEMFAGLDLANSEFDTESMQQSIIDLAEKFDMNLVDAIDASRDKFKELRKEAKDAAKSASSSIAKLFEESAKKSAESAKQLSVSMAEIQEALFLEDRQLALAKIEELAKKYGVYLPESLKKSILEFKNLGPASQAALLSAVENTLKLNGAFRDLQTERFDKIPEFTADLEDLRQRLADMSTVQDFTESGTLDLSSEMEAVQEFADQWGIDVVEAYKLATAEAEKFGAAAEEAAKSIDLDQKARTGETAKASAELTENVKQMTEAADAYNAAMQSIAEAQSELIRSMKEVDAESNNVFADSAQELLDLYNDIGNIGGSIIKDGILQPKLWERIAEIAQGLGISVVDGISLASDAMRGLVEEQKQAAEEISAAWSDLFSSDQTGTKDYKDALEALSKQLLDYGNDQERVKRAIEAFAETWGLDLVDAISQADDAMKQATDDMQANIDATREAWQEYNDVVSGKDSAMKEALKDLADQLKGLGNASVNFKEEMSGIGALMLTTGQDTQDAARLIEEFAEKWGLELPEAIKLATEAMREAEKAQDAVLVSADFASAGAQSAWEDLVQGLVEQSDLYKSSLASLGEQLYGLRNNTEAMKPYILAFAAQWGISLEQAISISANAIKTVQDSINAAAEKAAREAEARLEKIKARAKAISDAFADLFDTFKKESTPYQDALSALGQKLFDHQGDVDYVKNAIKEFADVWGLDLVDAIGEAKSAFLDFIRGHDKFSDWWSGIGNTAEDLQKEREFIESMIKRFGGNTTDFSPVQRMLPGFASGGSFMVGGRSGIDQNVVSFRASRGERVTVQTPQQQQSGGQTVYVAYNNYAPIYGDPSKKTGDKLAAAVAEGYNRAARRGQVAGLRKI